jgi:hypothetical protein
MPSETVYVMSPLKMSPLGVVAVHSPTPSPVSFHPRFDYKEPTPREAKTPDEGQMVRFHDAAFVSNGLNPQSIHSLLCPHFNLHSCSTTES